MDDGGWDGHVTSILIAVIVGIRSFVGYCGFVAIFKLVDAIDLEVVGEGGSWQKEGQQKQEKMDVLFHCRMD